MTLHKDIALDKLAEVGNVAQFVAFRPNGTGALVQSTARVVGMEPNAPFAGPAEAAANLLATSADNSVNVRSYLPDDPRSREFVYGIKSAEEAIAHLSRLASAGLHVILNETIDVNDGGVSGVVQGGIIEFAPDDTPRAVEKPDVASFPRDMGLALLKTAYGFSPEVPGDLNERVEFSIHPLPRGWRRTNTLLWEIEHDTPNRPSQPPRWPNRFSRHLGDKAFGLLVANWLGAPVPATTVIGRRVAPFSFGHATGSATIWMRTCPREPQPGLYTTSKGWRDPFELLSREDPDSQIASVIAQAGVPAVWSGAAIVGSNGSLILEGRRGEGDVFMLGAATPDELPDEIAGSVTALHESLSRVLGPVRIEWVHDGTRPWVVQLHIGATQTNETAIVDGDATHWIEFDVSRGLPELRRLLVDVPEDTGILLLGEVGLTSHVADLLRKWDRPARMKRA